MFNTKMSILCLICYIQQWYTYYLHLTFLMSFIYPICFSCPLKQNHTLHYEAHNRVFRPLAQSPHIYCMAESGVQVQEIWLQGPLLNHHSILISNLPANTQLVRLTRSSVLFPLTILYISAPLWQETCLVHVCILITKHRACTNTCWSREYQILYFCFSFGLSLNRLNNSNLTFKNI